MESFSKSPVKWKLGADSDSDSEDEGTEDTQLAHKVKTINNSVDYFIVNLPATTTQFTSPSKRYKLLNSIFIFLQYIFTL